MLPDLFFVMKRRLTYCNKWIIFAMCQRIMRPAMSANGIIQTSDTQDMPYKNIKYAKILLKQKK